MAKLSKLEQTFIEAWRLHAAGFPEPEHQHVIDGSRFDFAWPDYRIAVELDGIGWGHSTIAMKRDDATKQRAAVVLGWRVLRFTTGCLGSKAQREQAVHAVLYLMADVPLPETGNDSHE